MLPGLGLGNHLRLGLEATAATLGPQIALTTMEQAM